MSNIIGKIANINGTFYAKGLDGSLREISEGAEIYEGETIIGAQSNNSVDSIIVSLYDGSDITVFGKESQLFDASVTTENFAIEDTVTQKDSIQNMLNEYGDIDNIEELDTAAGEEGGAESTEGGEANFATANKDAITDINADLRHIEFANEEAKLNRNSEEENRRSELNNDKNLNADTSVVEPAGNTSATASETALGADTAIATPTITLETADANADGIYNAAELGEDGTVTATISVAGSEVGDTLTYTDDGTSTSVTLTSENIANGITLHVNPEATVTATLSDAAGNTSATASETALGEDTAIATPIITLETADANADGIYNAAELGEDGTVTATISVAGSEVGDTLTYTDDGTSTSVTLTSENIANGITIHINPESTVTATLSDAAGNTSATASETALGADIEAPDITQLAITNIIDNNGDYSSVTMVGTGAETGNTITLYDEDNNPVATTTVQADGTWSTDISSLNATPLNDNEFFSVTETDAAGNVTAQTDTTHYAHYNWGNAQTDNFDDYDIAGSGNDNLAIDDNDLNDHLVFDGGDGVDTATFSGNMADYTITTDVNGYTIVTESASTDSDGDGRGDVNELRNVENITFKDGKYDATSGVFTPNDTTADTVNDTATTNEDSFVIINVLANDEAGSTITSVNTPLNANGEALGSVEIVMVDGIQQVKFTPAENFDSLNSGQSSDVSFTYSTKDALGNNGSATATVTVEGLNNDLTYVSESAGYKNVIGIYEVDTDGNPVSGTVVIDDQNGMTGGTHLADLDPTKDYDFFIIANGANEINENSVITFDNSGDRPILLINGNAAAHPVYFTEPSFNPDGEDHFKFELDGKGGTTISIEDLPNLGDADFGDVVLHTNFEMANRIAVNADLADTSDTGVSNTDNITSDSTPTITGNTEQGATVVITNAAGVVVGSGVADKFGDYSITTTELAEGTQTLSITATDVDGNSAVTTQEITIGTADGLTATMDVSLLSELTTQVVDTNAMAQQGITQGEDGNYYHKTYEATAKLMKTETIEVGKAENIRLDEAPEHGVVEVQGSDGSWSQMAVGKEYSANSEVRFVADESAVKDTKDIKIGTFGENEGTKSFTGHADVSDWGKVSANGKSVTFTDGELSVKTTVIQNGQEQKLGSYNSSGNDVGSGIGDSDGSGLSRGETLVVSIEGGNVNQVVFQLDGLGGYFDKSSSHATQVSITAYDAQGNVIDSQGGYRESGKFADMYEFTTNVPVHHFEITTSGSDGNYVVQNMTLSKTIVDDVKFTAIAADGTEVSLTSDINIQEGMSTTNITSLVPASNEPMTKDVKVVDVDAMQAKGAMLVDGHWVVESGVEQVSPPMMNEISGYEYQINIDAALNDTDGSESFSQLTITNLPEGVTLQDSNGNIINANSDGSYTVAINEKGDASAIMVSSTEIAPDALNSITATVTATENSTGDTAEIEVNAKIDINGTDADDTIDGTDADEKIDGRDGADTINAGGGDDTIIFDANDTVDGGDGLDTLVFSADMDIDLGALSEGVSNIEVISLGEGQQNITSISLDDVLNITDTDNLLRIDGDESDSINLNTLGDDAEWTLGDFKTDSETGGEYQEYTAGEGDSTVTLEISADIDINEM